MVLILVILRYVNPIKIVFKMYVLIKICLVLTISLWFGSDWFVGINIYLILINISIESEKVCGVKIPKLNVNKPEKKKTVSRLGNQNQKKRE